MRVEVEQRDGVRVLRLAGGEWLDAASVGGVKSEAVLAIDGRADIVVDVAGIAFIDSAGLGLLVSLVKAARLHGRSLALTGVRPPVRRILEIIQLDRILELREGSAAGVGER
ncbi:MAG TPA: STAS domain-containing protein [Candidatus Polarisedimenticolaceae bacterium]|nr:STAS domain-containing protein [Candidatus Polarisedimenticolaceae bacterium]